VELQVRTGMKAAAPMLLHGTIHNYSA
jgi:hypothetical protein